MSDEMVYASCFRELGRRDSMPMARLIPPDSPERWKVC
jgi:hypothetical protein